ncbi:MAG: GIY-YIG nuclease family protein [Verrucomicrobia bacterium]|nr:GIY-YIG nuclease family protein [Verrucomicrobiota bacterium]
MAWVYVIQNAEGRIYIGMTTDLDRRLVDHNSGISKWTKYRGPWKLVWNQKDNRNGDRLIVARENESRARSSFIGNTVRLDN